jgi:hypothetical protein
MTSLLRRRIVRRDPQQRADMQQLLRIYAETHDEVSQLRRARPRLRRVA